MNDVHFASAIAWIKIAGYAVSAWFFTFTGLPQETTVILMQLMIVDFATGLGKAHVLDKSKITSYTGARGIMKKATSLVVLFALIKLGSGIGLNTSGMVNLFMSGLITYEVYSIMQNSYAIRTGKILPEYDVISIMIKNGSEMIMQLLEKKMGFEKSKKLENTDDFIDGAKEFVTNTNGQTKSRVEQSKQ